MSLVEELGSACPVRPAEHRDAVDGVPARAVASPQDTAQTGSLLRACHQQGLAVVATGRRSKLHWGRPPRRLDVLLETTAMNTLVEHSQGDLIATVGAGMPLADLNATLGQARQQLVIDDPAGGGTIGGVLGTALCGPRRLWVGAPRDLVLGVTVVRADGTVAKSGGKVVKNVAGYDVGKLLTGSYGTLGVITQATFRLHPVPEASRWVLADVPDQKLASALRAIRSSQLVPQALEIDARSDGSRHGDPGVIRLAVLFSGTSAGSAARTEAAVGLLAAVGVESAPGSQPEWVGALPGDTADQPLVKLTTKLSGMPSLLSACRQWGVSVRGSAGVGVLHGRIASTAVADVAAAVRDLRSQCVALGGSLVVLDATLWVKAGVDVWGDDDVPGLDLMRRVKHEFDPAGTLAPGRFVGGI